MGVNRIVVETFKFRMENPIQLGTGDPGSYHVRL